MRWRQMIKDVPVNQWYPWFAWRPVYCWYGDDRLWVWREWIWRHQKWVRGIGMTGGRTETNHRITEPEVKKCL